jgi:hypothetical protein
MPRKCLNHPVTFYDVCGEMTFNCRGKILNRSLGSIMSFILGVKRVAKIKVGPLICYLAPLHIKFGFIKNFVKEIDQNTAGFMYLRNKFPRISDGQIEEGVFVDLQTRELIQDVKFEDQLSEVQKAAWK